MSGREQSDGMPVPEFLDNRPHPGGMPSAFSAYTVKNTAHIYLAFMIRPYHAGKLFIINKIWVKNRLI
jgi:hypothetical protein